ncbi:hypothetical protein [Litorihabitans aurantiacus]|uniref:Cell division protein FtsL n=1 Tax=Litorihabitans aurantiacus TaxID=1930061 RepID=A0AA37XEF2_9MICO|nr:hypothetical protein [Litorihabitans aurantiacus]GMA31729.1 hypothetical protein GCM10025875_17210 [Litorihabitans aurantiacus]
MSAAPARITPVARPGSAATGSAARGARGTALPRLRLVRQTRAEAARVPFFAVCAGVLLASLLAALGLNTSMAATSYAIRDKQAELATARQDVESLSGRVEAASSPAQVMAQAAELGLVPNPGLVYIRLSDGTLVGGQ